MEVSVIGSSQGNLGSLSKNLDAKMCRLGNNIWKGYKSGRSQSLLLPSKSAFAFTLRASCEFQQGVDVKASKFTRSRLVNDIKLFVGLPLDTVSFSNTINHERAIVAGLKALKLLGVDGVELPVYWGIAEKKSMGKYEWESYLTIVEMVQEMGLKLHVSLYFHSVQEHKIPLPDWVSRIGEIDPNIYFTDRSRQQYKDCLSLAVDDLPVLDGKTPVEVYKAFCNSFKSTFSNYLGSTIMAISIGLGPDGELRYPSHHQSVGNHGLPGAGEFQCYDKYMLGNLKQHAETEGNPLWGLGGPHDSPGYAHNPISRGFFMENGGSWESPYGNFFLSWYSNLLIYHGDRILSLAASAFNDVPIMVSGKVPLIHSWYQTCSHPAELTAGFYNTCNRDGYKAIAEIFSKHSCKMILPGVDQSAGQLPSESRSNPESLLKQLTSCCRDHGIPMCGQNLMVSGVSTSFKQIKNIINDDYMAMDQFTYQRMGAYFFSPEHFPLFAQFVQSLKQATPSIDDLPGKTEEAAESLIGSNLQLQAA